MTFPALGSFVLGAVVNIALLSYGARRLLAERRFSLSRTVVAGLAGSALAMAILVTWQAFLPAGTVPLISSWPRSVRSRVARGLRYWQIVRIFTQCGLRPLWRGGTSRPASLKEAATGEIMALLPMLRRLPRRMDRITAAVEGGRLRVNVRLLADERDRQTINGWLQLGVLTVLAASAGIMAVALLALKGGPVMTATVSLYQFLGYCLLVICSLLALRVLAAVFRAPG